MMNNNFLYEAKNISVILVCSLSTIFFPINFAIFILIVSYILLMYRFYFEAYTVQEKIQCIYPALLSVVFFCGAFFSEGKLSIIFIYLCIVIFCRFIMNSIFFIMNVRLSNEFREQLFQTQQYVFQSIDKFDRSQKSLAEFELAMKSLFEDYENQLNQLKRRYKMNPDDVIFAENLTKNLTNKISQEFDKKKQELNQELEDKKIELNQEVDERKIEFNQEVNARKTEFKQEIEDKKIEFNQEIDERKTEFKQELEDKKIEFNQEIEDKKIEFNQEVDERKTEIKQEVEDGKTEITEITRKFSIIIENQDEYIRELEKSKKEHNIILENAEIKAKFNELLDIAEHEIDIFSPWLNEVVIDNKMKKSFKNLLEKNVIIKIRYGIGNDSRFELTESVARALAREFKNYNNFKLHKDNTHAKLFICDEKFYVLSSFNILSFDGNYNKKYVRHEMGEYSTNKEILIKYRKKYFYF